MVFNCTMCFNFILNQQFAETGSDERLLLELACNVVVEGGSLDTLREVLSVYPDHVATTPEDILMDTLRLLISHWQGNKVSYS